MLYLSPYVGGGVRSNPFRPCGIENSSEWSSIDIRPDFKDNHGLCLLTLPDSVTPHSSLIAIGCNKSEIICSSSKRFLGNRLSLTLDKCSIGAVVGKIMCTTGKAWKPLKPNLIRRRYELYFGGECWWELKAFGGASYSDTFTRANENPIASPWVKGGSGHNWQILTNALQGVTTDDDSWLYYNNTTPDDQFSQATVGALSVNADFGMAVRIAGGATQTFYLTINFNGGPLIAKFVAGSFTSLGAVTAVTIVNDVVRAEVIGSSMHFIKNGSDVLGSPVTDTSITSGFSGFFAAEIANRFINWSGSSPSSGGGAGPLVGGSLLEGALLRGGRLVGQRG